MSSIFTRIFTQPLFNLLIVLTVWIPGHSLGWAIILLTILIRLILTPSAAQAIKQQQKLQLMQPELKKLQDQYKDDKEAQARETMALYKKYDIHPLGSCLPLLVQLPVLFALIAVFRSGLSTANFHELYSFIPHPATLNTHFLGIDLAKPDHYFILPVIAGALQFLQSRQMVRINKNRQIDQTQQMMNLQLLYLMPVLTIVISFSLPAALPLYWVITTLYAIAQQAYLFRLTPQSASISTEPVTAKQIEVTSPSAPANSSPSTGEKTEQHGNVSVTVRTKK